MNTEQRLKRIEKKLGISGGRWKPEKGEKFFTFYGEGSTGLLTYHEGEQRYAFGSCFRTKEQAEEAAKRVKETLLKYHEELGE